MLEGAARVLVSEVVVRCCRILLQQWFARSGAGFLLQLVPLQGGASGRVPLQRAAVGFFSEVSGSVARGE